MISVVVPAYNAAATIGDQLAALSAQSDGVDWELIVADNGSTDGTLEVVEDWSDRLPLRVVDASERKGPAAARNIGAGSAAGDVLAFTDADDIIQPGWLEAVREVSRTNWFSTGPVLRFRDAHPALPMRSQGGSLFMHMGFLPYADGANFLIRRALFEHVGGFDERYRTGEDVELSWRLQLAGERLVFAEGAAVGSRVRTDSRAVFRQYFGYGWGDVQLYVAFRGRGLTRPPIRASVRSYAGLLARVPLLFREQPREAWLHQVGRRLGRLFGSVVSRVVFP